MAKKVLITGGSGMVGRQLTSLLLTQGYEVAWLSRSGRAIANVQGFKWDIENQWMDDKALDGIEAVIHLAGEGIADKRWTGGQREKILDSRIKSAELLYNTLQKTGTVCNAFISASGSGYYGYDNGTVLLDETHPVGEDFVANVVDQWEKAVDKFVELGARVVKLRIGVVLSTDGGALPKLAQPIKFGVGAPLGTGQQIMSWVHIEDLCKAFHYALTNENMNGVYNLVSSNPVTNSEMTKQVAKLLKRPLILPNIPATILKLLLGEMSNLVLGSQNLSNEKIKSTGFSFDYEHVTRALNNILKMR